MMSGIPGPPPGGGNLTTSVTPLNGGSALTGDSFSEPVLMEVKTEQINSDIKLEAKIFTPQIINGGIGDIKLEGLSTGPTRIHPHVIKVEPVTSTTPRHIMPQQRPMMGTPVRQVILQGQTPPARILTPRQPRPIAPTAPLTASSDVSSSAPVPLSEDEQRDVHKCKNFLMTLIQLAQRNASADREVVTNVRDLVQRLIDDRITAQEFTERLQTELQSSPQPYLVPFLEKSLPLLRRSMQTSGSGQRTVRAPTVQIRPPPAPISQVRQGTPRPIRPVPAVATRGSPHIRLPRNMPTRIRPGTPSNRIPGEPPNKISTMDRVDDREADDITDVTAMANINIDNEARNLSSLSTEVGYEVRSAPGGDKAVSVNEQILHKLVGQAASKAGGIQRVTPDGARLIGLALEDYVKTIVSRAIHAASHRSIQFKESEHIEKLNDVKSQFKYITDLMIIEKQQADEAEQEQRAKLLRSRKGKDDDPDRDKKKKEAKLKQQQLQDAQQLKQADETALEASRRRPRNVQAPASTANSSGGNRPARICRVKIRDLLFCLENDKLADRSRDELFKRYLK